MDSATVSVVLDKKLEADPSEPVPQPGPASVAAVIPLQTPSARNKSGGPSKPSRRKKPPPEPVRLDVLHTPWLARMPDAPQASAERMLHEEIAAYEAYMTPTAAERTIRETFVHRATEVIKNRVRDARVHTYGSSATGLSLPGGDVDMTFQTSYANDEQSSKTKLFQLRGALTRDGVAAQAFVNTHARHLVMSIEGPPNLGGYKADIFINSMDGVDGVSIVNDYVAQLPAVRPLVLVLKGLLALHKLGSAASSGLSSYCVISMVKNFLQVNPYALPRVSVDDPRSSFSLGTLFLQFLQYYSADFPYETSYISVRAGAVLLKDSKAFNPPRQASDSLSIECMVNPDIDIARSAGRMRQVRELFTKSKGDLQLAIDANASGSVLSKILGVSQETLDYRARIAQLVASRQHARTNPPAQNYNFPRDSHSGGYRQQGPANSNSLFNRIGGYSDSRSSSAGRTQGSYDRHGPASYDSASRRDYRSNDRRSDSSSGYHRR